MVALSGGHVGTDRPINTERYDGTLRFAILIDAIRIG
jgi:hypothetical protein